MAVPAVSVPTRPRGRLGGWRREVDRNSRQRRRTNGQAQYQPVQSDHIASELLARDRSQAPDKRHAPDVVGNASGAGKGTRRPTRHSDDSKPAQCELIRQFCHICSPGTDRSAWLERGFAETGTIGAIRRRPSRRAVSAAKRPSSREPG